MTSDVEKFLRFFHRVYGGYYHDKKLILPLPKDTPWIPSLKFFEDLIFVESLILRECMEFDEHFELISSEDNNYLTIEIINGNV